jgi:hypothetical protein
MITSGSLSFAKEIGKMGVWEFNPESLESIWLKASKTLGGGRGILAENHHDWRYASRAPFELSPFPYN